MGILFSKDVNTEHLFLCVIFLKLSPPKKMWFSNKLGILLGLQREERELGVGGEKGGFQMRIELSI